MKVPGIEQIAAVSVIEASGSNVPLSHENQRSTTWIGTALKAIGSRLRARSKEQWGKLTDDDLDVIAGKRDQLEGKIQERYGYAKDQARKDIDDWYNTQRWQ